MWMLGFMKAIAIFTKIIENKEKKMSVPIGFKRLTIRIKDGKTAVPDKNQFVIEGKKDNGGMVSAKVSGLAVDAVKSYSSNKVYSISGKGVGDGKVEFDIMDFPEKIKNAVLGIVASSNGVYKATADRTSPYCSILLEDVTPQGHPYLMAFLDGMFSKCLKPSCLINIFCMYLWSACEEQKNMEEIKMKTHHQILNIVSTVCHASIFNP